MGYPYLPCVNPFIPYLSHEAPGGAGRERGEKTVLESFKRSFSWSQHLKFALVDTSEGLSPFTKDFRV